MAGQLGTKKIKVEASLAGKEIHVEPTRPGMHEIAEDISARTIWRITQNQRSNNSSWLSHIKHIFDGSNRYVKLPVRGLNIPREAAQHLQQISDSPPDETAIFLSTRLGSSEVDALLAARFSKRWRELYRWRASWKDLGISRLAISEL